MRHLLLAASLLLPVAAAHAESFTITVSANGLTESGTLVGNSTGNADGSYLITSIAGVTGVSLLAPNDPVFGNDNLFFPSNSRLFDVNGIAFSGAFGTANLFSTVGGFEVQGFDVDNDFFDVPVSAALTSSTVTPEPSSIVLSLTGLLATAGGMLRRRFTAAQTGTV